MAQLKDLLVTGPVRLLSDVVLGHDPTAALHAATKQYVDASAGKLTVGALTSGTTYYPILATGTGMATRQIDSSLPGLTYVKTNGTTGAEGAAVLSLGNTTASGTAGNASGRLALYDYSGKKATILPRAVTSHIVDTALYLPDWGTSTSTYLVATTTTNAVGSSTVPVYIDAKGIVQQCARSIPYVILNGLGTTTPTFYAPTAAGGEGQLLQSAGAGISPTWTNFADLIPVSDNYYDVLDYNGDYPTETLMLSYTSEISPEQCYAELSMRDKSDYSTVSTALEYVSYMEVGEYSGPCFFGSVFNSQDYSNDIYLFVNWEEGTATYFDTNGGDSTAKDFGSPVEININGQVLSADPDFATAIDNTNKYNHAKVTVLFPEDGYNAVATAVDSNEGAIFYVYNGTSYIYRDSTYDSEGSTFIFSQSGVEKPFGETENFPHTNELRVSHSSSPTSDVPVIDTVTCSGLTAASPMVLTKGISTLKPSSTLYGYRLVFTSVDGTRLVPICTQSSTQATYTKTITTTPIDPFGPIYYYRYSYSTGTYSGVPGEALCTTCKFDIRQSFYSTATINSYVPIYLKCSYNSSGQCLINQSTPFVYALPTTADSDLYILIGYHHTTGKDMLIANHPVYRYNSTLGRVVPAVLDVQ